MFTPSSNHILKTTLYKQIAKLLAFKDTLPCNSLAHLDITSEIDKLGQRYDTLVFDPMPKELYDILWELNKTNTAIEIPLLTEMSTGNFFVTTNTFYIPDPAYPQGFKNNYTSIYYESHKLKDFPTIRDAKAFIKLMGWTLYNELETYK